MMLIKLINNFHENIGAGFCKYDMTTAEKLNIKELNTCLESSVTREFAKEMTEQYKASHAQYLKCNKILVINEIERIIKLNFKITSFSALVQALKKPFPIY